MVRRKSSSGWGPSLVSVRLAVPPPAVLTAMCRPPRAATASPSAASTWFSSRTSTSWNVPPSSLATSAPAELGRSRMATSAPFWRSSSAVALAMPDAPPTTTAFFPWISTACSSLLRARSVWVSYSIASAAGTFAPAPIPKKKCTIWPFRPGLRARHAGPACVRCRPPSRAAHRSPDLGRRLVRGQPGRGRRGRGTARSSGQRRPFAAPPRTPLTPHHVGRVRATRAASPPSLPVDPGEEDAVVGVGRAAGRDRLADGQVGIDAGVTPGGAQGVPGTPVAGRRHRAKERMRSASTSGRSLCTAWPASSTRTTSSVGRRRCISAASWSRT